MSQLPEVDTSSLQALEYGLYNSLLQTAVPAGDSRGQGPHMFHRDDIVLDWYSLSHTAAHADREAI
jgi:hypothetical protein